jgi:hypothetical protein
MEMKKFKCISFAKNISVGLTEDKDAVALILENGNGQAVSFEFDNAKDAREIADSLHTAADKIDPAFGGERVR